MVVQNTHMYLQLHRIYLGYIQQEHLWNGIMDYQLILKYVILLLFPHATLPCSYLYDQI